MMDPIRSDIIAVQGYGISMVGGRAENQDDWGYTDTPLGFLLVVCDGMGGGPGGATASAIVKREFAIALRECNSSTQPDKAIRMATVRAQEALERRMVNEPSLQGMGSTFVALLVSKQSAFIAHAGDSRCYQFRGKRCIYRSKDHSLVAELVRKKALTEEEARLSPQSNVISRGLGNVSNHVPEIDEVCFKRGDRFVICTDGIWGAMPHHELLSRLTAQGQLSAISGNLSMEVDSIGFANGGHHDNHTLTMIEVLEDSVKKASFVSNIILPHLDIRKNTKLIIYTALSTLALSTATIVTIQALKGCGDDERKTNISQTSSGIIFPELGPKGQYVEIVNDAFSDGKRGSTDSEEKREKNDSIDVPDSDTTTVALESVFDKIRNMKNVKADSVAEAVKRLENGMDTIINLLDSLWQGGEDSVKVAFLEKLKQKKGQYSNYNKVGKKKPYKPTTNAIRTLNRIEKELRLITGTYQDSDAE